MWWLLLFAGAEDPAGPVVAPAEPVAAEARPPSGAKGGDLNPAVDAAPGPPEGWLPPRMTPPATPFVVGGAAADVAASWPIDPSSVMPGSFMIGGSTGMTHNGERVRGVVSVDGGVISRINFLGASGSCSRRREDLVRAFGEPSSTDEAPTARVDRWLGSERVIEMTEAGKQCGVAFGNR